MGALWHHLAALLAKLRTGLNGAFRGIHLHRVSVVHAHLQNTGVIGTAALMSKSKIVSLAIPTRKGKHGDGRYRFVR